MSVVRRKYGSLAWTIGLFVMLAIGIAVASMLRDGQRPLVAQLGGATGRSTGQEGPVAPLPALGVDRVRPAAAVAPTVSGVVLLPDRQPAAGAVVTVYRALSAWPEWRRERIDQAVTGADGVFQFRLADELGLLVGVAHERHAGDLVEVPGPGVPLELQLEPGFELFGFVVNDRGAPLRNVRVSVESVPGDQRRCETVLTAEDGRYAFPSLRAGAVRVVARHEAWQPAVEPAIVIGDQRRCNLRFDRPHMAPLRGRVVAVGSQTPIADASVQLLPINQKLGLGDPVAAITGADGSFLLDGLARGSMRLLVRHPQHGGVMMSQTIGATTSELLIEMPPRTTVTGRLEVEGEQGIELGGATLAIIDALGQLEHATVAADGSFRFASPLSPGYATLRVLGRRFLFQRAMATEMAVRIDESTTCTLDQQVVAPTRLTGRVLDDGGRPLGGVVLTRTRLIAEDARSLSAAAWQLDIRAVGSQVFQLFGSDRDEVVAVSAADGSFVIHSDKAGPMLLRLTSPGRGSLLQRVIVPTGSATVALGDHVLVKGHRLEGRVLRGNRRLTGALVTAVTVDGELGQGQTVTGADGAFVIDGLVAGAYRVVARLPSLPNGTRERTVQVGAGDDEPVLLVLDAGRTVHGVVTGSDGQPLPGVFVGVRGAGASTATTDVNGDFLLELPDRAVDLQLSFGDRASMQSVHVPLGQERVEVVFDTPATGTLVAQVASLPGKKRVRSALLRVVALAGDADGEQFVRWVELNDGELRLTCPVGRHRIEIRCEGHAPFVAVRELASGEVLRLGDVLLEPGARLRGVVRDEDGRPVAGAGVLLGEETDLDVLEPRVVTAADGSFELTGVTSRSARLVVRASGAATRVLDLELPRDVLTPEPLVVTLERGTMIEVSVPPDLARDTGLVQLRRQGRVLASAVLDEQGRAWFANRGAGTYSIELFGSRQSPKVVTVPPATPLLRVRLP
ncbi:MAG: carboxypeptidase regulatory-like domain-containing protein [Planctomycetes bacterium]|nr:carboxypeptidase regulatory-like domain-containing protein [Planctomycetota bacterium]